MSSKTNDISPLDVKEYWSTNRHEVEQSNVLIKLESVVIIVLFTCIGIPGDGPDVEIISIEKSIGSTNAI